MSRPRAVFVLCALLTMPGLVKNPPRTDAADSSAVKALFADPPRQYSSAPLWVWNDMLTDDQITSTMQDLADQNVKQVFVHPRPGLMTPYLGEDWFRLWKVALREAERLDMNVWIYDENSYPSGFAGGLVPEAMPESRGKRLDLVEVREAKEIPKDAIAFFHLTENSFQRITTQTLKGENPPKGPFLAAVIRLAPERAWHGGKYYVDLLHPGVTEKFIEITFERYKREIGDQFGKRVPGIFTDEPHLSPAGGIHWSTRIPADFRKRWGYDILNHLPCLVRPVGDWKRVRHNFQQFLLEEFIDSWAKPCYEWCEKNGLEFTGHYWEHGWPGASHGGDNMAMYAWQQRPAIDTLMNEYRQDTHAQFGNARAVKELSSVANQLGRKRTLCEAYGAGGWDLRFEDMKRIGDWLYVLGVNTLDEHLSYITIRGARKRDHPQSFSYHEPWWEGYHLMASYFTRLSLALSEGEQVNHVLLLEPTTSAWMYQPDKSGREALYAIANPFQDLINALEAVQAEYDLGCEDIIGRHGKVEKVEFGGSSATWFVVGRQRYHTVVLPVGTENLNAKTMDLLEEYLKAGGEVVVCGEPPERVDGQVSDRGKKLAEAKGWKKIYPDEAAAEIQKRSANGLTIRRAEGDRGNLFHHRRRLDDGQILFLVNTSITDSSSGEIVSSLRGVEKWDPQTGKVEPYAFSVVEKTIKAAFSLPPCGSLLLFLADEPRKPAAVKPGQVTVIQPTAPPKIQRIEPNVLTLDYVDVAAKGEKLENVYFYKAQQFVFQKNGLDRNPWDSAVQLRDHLIKKKFPPDSGFEAAYRFTIREKIPETLWIVIERPDLYTVACNGTTVTAKQGDWWLDKAFGKVSIAHAAVVGENKVTIIASPMTMFHELEPAYLLGDFSLKPVEVGFEVYPPKPLEIASNDAHVTEPDDSGLNAVGWDKMGHPFYAAGVSYTQEFEIDKPAGRYLVSIPHWYGSVAKVAVNGNLAGYIGYRPWECDATEWVKPGKNTVEVTVIGTLKNTLGPHHNSPAVGRAWPSAFRNAPDTGPPPGNRYHTIGYGLFEPFVLKNVTN